MRLRNRCQMSRWAMLLRCVAYSIITLAVIWVPALRSRSPNQAGVNSHVRSQNQQITLNSGAF